MNKSLLRKILVLGLALMLTVMLAVCVSADGEAVVNDGKLSIFNFLSLFGGVALFLFGMDYMGKGLEKSAGSSLERILERLTSNPIKGVILGAIVTAVIQSSGATTVMVVGFVNSGIMKLTQAIGIIMGANIGTTATAWILTLAGGDGGGAWYIEIFKASNLAAISAFVGILMIMICKNSRKKDIGSIFIGFAVLMFGMTMMTEALAPLKYNQGFADILALFTNPVLGILAGAVITTIMQSSSASVGIMQAISATGALSFGAAIPMIMGQNIGSTTTAMISTIGAGKNAKRTAAVHFYFNVIGTAIFLIGYYALDAIFDFGLDAVPVNSTTIAITHTVFNISATVLLLPFYKLLGRLAELTIRDSACKVQINTADEHPLLDERFLQTPSFALEQCVTVMGKMAELSVSSINTAMELVDKYTDDKGNEIRAIENEVDKYEDRLGTYLVKLSSKDLSIEDSKTATRLLHNIGDLERISDHAVNIQEAAKEMSEKGITFSPEAQKELRIISMALSEILTLTVDALIRNDLHAATHVEPLEQVIDDLKDKIREKHIDRLQGGKCTIELGFILSDLLTNYERVSDHCSNIAACMIKAAEQSYDMHKYLSDLKSEHSFMDEYRACSEKYAID